MPKNDSSAPDRPSAASGNNANAVVALETRFAETLEPLLKSDSGCTLWVAFSGGQDSTVLLHLAHKFAQQRPVSLRAVHIDHGLDPESGNWAAQCASAALALGVDCRVIKLDQVPPPGASIEQWAREQRYQAFSRVIDPNAYLLTAHHLDDQCETILQRALSGSGPHGLRGIHQRRSLGCGELLRPLLHRSKLELANYASESGLRWLDDPSNLDPRFLRNRIRHGALPAIDDAVPGARDGLLRLAEIQSLLAATLDRQCDALIDLQGLPRYMLNLQLLAEQEESLLGFVIRRALHRAGLGPVSYKVLREIQFRLCRAGSDANPLVAWGSNQIRRYRNFLYFMRGPSREIPAGATPWSANQRLSIAGGELSMRSDSGWGLDPTLLNKAKLSVQFRHGGERCVVAGRQHRQSLKKLFQAWAVPPWERTRTPLIYLDGELAAVGQWAICEGFAVAQNGLKIEWDPKLYRI